MLFSSLLSTYFGWFARDYYPATYTPCRWADGFYRLMRKGVDFLLCRAAQVFLGGWTMMHSTVHTLVLSD
jgi:hypothetical protein